MLKRFQLRQILTKKVKQDVTELAELTTHTTGNICMSKIDELTEMSLIYKTKLRKCTS